MRQILSLRGSWVTPGPATLLSMLLSVWFVLSFCPSLSTYPTFQMIATCPVSSLCFSPCLPVHTSVLTLLERHGQHGGRYVPAAQCQRVRLVTSLMYGETPGLPCVMPSKCFCVTSCSDPSRCGWTFRVNCVVHSLLLVSGDRVVLTLFRPWSMGMETAAFPDS